MAINQNHLFEELNGVKCAIVEKNVPAARVEFLRRILEFNGYTVVVVPSPPPKAAAVPAAGAAAPKAAPASPPTAAASSPTAAAPQPVPAPASAPASAPPQAVPAPSPPAPAPATTQAAVPPAPETFTVGVTDVMFNPINAIFGRLLKAPGGHVVTLAYWKQRDEEPDDERPYFEGR